MKNHPIIRAFWFAANALLLVSLVALLYSLG